MSDKVTIEGLSAHIDFIEEELDAIKKQQRAAYDADVLGINELRRRTADQSRRIENLEKLCNLQDQEPTIGPLRTIDAEIERNRILSIIDAASNHKFNPGDGGVLSWLRNRITGK